MEMTGQQRIAAPRQAVWAALNDPAILKQSIPGCQSLDMLDGNRMRAVAGVKIGPIGAKFTGEVTISDRDAPTGYRIDGEGQGGAAGFAKGGARVRLSEDGPDATLLDYEVNAEVGGRLAQLGSALIDASAKQMAAQFFKRFAAAVAEAKTPQSPPDATALEAAIAAPMPTPLPAATPNVAQTPALPWGLAALCAGLIGYILGRSASGWESSGAWPGLAIGLAFVVVAGTGFALGRQGTAR